MKLSRAFLLHRSMLVACCLALIVGRVTGMTAVFVIGLALFVGCVAVSLLLLRCPKCKRGLTKMPKQGEKAVCPYCGAELEGQEDC